VEEWNRNEQSRYQLTAAHVCAFSPGSGLTHQECVALNGQEKYKKILMDQNNLNFKTAYYQSY
jgi:hypothetical protein